jgi:hypothetical protein
MAKTCGTVGRESETAYGENRNHKWSKYVKPMLESCILAIVLKLERRLVSIENTDRQKLGCLNKVPS